MMWFPELFNRFDEYARAHNGSEQALVCEVRRIDELRINYYYNCNNCLLFLFLDWIGD